MILQTPLSNVISDVNTVRTHLAIKASSSSIEIVLKLLKIVIDSTFVLHQNDAKCIAVRKNDAKCISLRRRFLK